MKKTGKPRRRTPMKTKPSSPPLQGKWPVEFPEVKGKIIEAVKLYLHVDDCSLALVFSDKTQLNFDLEAGLTVRTELSDWKTRNWRRIKCWPPYYRDSFWLEEPCPGKP